MMKPKNLKLAKKEKELENEYRRILEHNSEISNEERLDIAKKIIPTDCLKTLEDLQDKEYMEISKKVLKRIKDEKGVSEMQGNADGDGLYHMSKSEMGRNLINTINKGESTIKGVRKTVTKAKIELNTPRITEDGAIKNLWEDYKEVNPVKIPEDLIMDM